MITPKQIKRILEDKSPKYSKNFRAFIRKQVKIYGDEGMMVVKHEGRRFIGHKSNGFFTGTTVAEAMTRGARVQTGAYMGGSAWPEVKSFGREYIRLGVCCLDPNHNWYNERWVTTGNIRTCKFCGCRERYKTVIVKHKRSSWEKIKNKK